MSELILLRNKIRSIQNIQKITYTMQLIAMSSLTAFRKKEEEIKKYATSVRRLLAITEKMPDDMQYKREKSISTILRKTLCVVIGSQKGLCGSFNTQLKRPIQSFLTHNSDYDMFVIGSQAMKVLEELHVTPIAYYYPMFSHRNRGVIAEELQKRAAQYDAVVVISNHFKSFFVQEAYNTTLFPLQDQEKKDTEQGVAHYIIDEPMENLHKLLIERYIHAQFSYLLYQSLLAEYAARFASMDSATRNAQTLLEQTKTTFNKLRQSKITTEITELSANFD